MNAFELICSMSKGMDLGNLFETKQEFKTEMKFTSKYSANEITSKIEEAAKPLGRDIHKKNYKHITLVQPLKEVYRYNTYIARFRVSDDRKKLVEEVEELRSKNQEMDVTINKLQGDLSSMQEEMNSVQEFIRGLRQEQGSEI